MKVLLAEDEEGLVELWKDLTAQMGIDLVSFANGYDAAKYIEKNYNDIVVYIFDLGLADGFDGRELVQLVMDLSEDNVVIVETGHHEINEVVDVMKKHVFEFLLKPVPLKVMRSTLEKAIERSRQLQENKGANALLKLKEYIHWNSYKESARVQAIDSHDKKLFYNLQTSLSQGSGVGATISLVDMIEASAVREGDHYTVDATMLDLLFENNKNSKIILRGLGKVLHLLETEFKKQRVHVSELFDRLKKSAEELGKYASRKRVTIQFSSVHDAVIEVDVEMVYLALEELLVNAIKYSVSGASVEVLSSGLEGYTRISVKNIIEKKDADKINESRLYIGEPFFRIHPPVEDTCDIEKFSIGSGIMAVEYIIKSSSGFFSFNTAVDYTGDAPRTCVVAEVMFEIKGEK